MHPLLPVAARCGVAVLGGCVAGLVALRLDPILALGLAVGLTAWVGHTAASEHLAQIVRAALKDAGYSDKQAALELGESPAHFSRDMAGQTALSLWRCASLSADFWCAFALRVLRAFGGGRWIVLEHGEVAQLIATIQAHTDALRRTGRTA